MPSSGLDHQAQTQCRRNWLTSSHTSLSLNRVERREKTEDVLTTFFATTCAEVAGVFLDEVFQTCAGCCMALCFIKHPHFPAIFSSVISEMRSIKFGAAISLNPTKAVARLLDYFSYMEKFRRLVIANCTTHPVVFLKAKLECSPNRLLDFSLL